MIRSRKYKQLIKKYKKSNQFTLQILVSQLKILFKDLRVVFISLTKT